MTTEEELATLRRRLDAWKSWSKDKSAVCLQLLKLLMAEEPAPELPAPYRQVKKSA